MNSQPSASSRTAQATASITAAEPEETETSMAEGLLFPEDGALIRSVLDLTRTLESLRIIEIVKDKETGADFYRILKRPLRVGTRNMSVLARRVGAIFGRRPSTLWTKEETEAFKAIRFELTEFNLADLELVEAYYKSEAKKPDNYCRRTLLTFLRHYPGEVDRARRWKDNSNRRHSY